MAKIKIKKRDMQPNDYHAWKMKNCYGKKCKGCPFEKVTCTVGEDCWVNNKDLFSDKFLDQEVEIERQEFTSKEVKLLSMLRKQYRWIARDKDGTINVYADKPTKGKEKGWWDDCTNDYFNLACFGCEFASISWEDEEPVDFRSIIKKGVK